MWPPTHALRRVVGGLSAFGGRAMQRPYTIAAFAERAGSGDDARQSALR